MVQLVQAAVTAGIDLIQIREKKLSAKVLYELSATAARLTSSSDTKLLINDRADIAAAAGADGVHLPTSSLPAAVVRETFGNAFVIGVSTHSLEEAAIAQRNGADFVVFGPVFATASKLEYGEPAGLNKLAKVCRELSPFPVLALGGVTTSSVADCIQAGAQGIAAITMFNEPARLSMIVDEIRQRFA